LPVLPELASRLLTAATNAFDDQGDIAKVQKWLGHAGIPTTRLL